MADSEVQFIDDDPPERFTLADNGFIDTPDLSWKSTAILIYLKGRPKGWQVRISHLAKVKTDGRTSVLNGIQELVELGYMRRDILRDEKAHVTGVSYRFSWHPRWANDDSRFGLRRRSQKPSSAATQTGDLEGENLETGNLITGLPDTGSPDTEDLRLVSTEPQQTLIPPSTEPPRVASPETAVSTPDGADARASKPKVDPLKSEEQRWVDARELATAVRDRWFEQYGGDAGRPAITKTVVEEADKLLRLGAVGIAAPTPVPLPKALALVRFMHEHMATPDNRGFAWARVTESAASLRRNYLKIATLANEQRRASGSRSAPADDGREAAREWAANRRRERDQAQIEQAQPPQALQLLPGGRTA